MRGCGIFLFEGMIYNKTLLPWSYKNCVNSGFSMSAKVFNIRVYGILIAEERILVTDEYRMGQYMTKLPGGGLQFGEGAIDAVKREFQEELCIHIAVLQHFYTTDFFQPSAFNPKHQIISIYYLVSTPKA